MKSSKHVPLGPAMRNGLALALLVSLSGCAAIARVDGNSLSARPAAASVDGETDWAWDVSGDAVVRPLQVFSLRDRTYLQMLPGQRIPAVLVDGSAIPFTISPPYIVVQGTSQRYDLMADGYRAVIAHRGQLNMPATPAAVDPSRVQRMPSTALLPGVPDPTTSGFVNVAPAREIAHPQVDLQQASVAATATQSADEPRVWRMDPSQRLLSVALAEWAKQAGTELVWKSDVDLPIRAVADYTAPKFFAAMSDVLADASNSGYRFFYAVNGRVVTIISVKQS